MAETKGPSTQQHLDIEDIKDDLVILKNGDISMILETDSLNFELLDEKEQDARILGFANLLNSLNFIMQIVVRTERKDVNDYIEKLIAFREKQISKALRKQMEIYIKFVRNLTVKTEILDKRFFIVIPAKFSPVSKGFSVSDMVFGGKQTVNIYQNLQKAKDDLYPKREYVIKQFRKLGMNVAQLTTDEAVQLFVDIYDPDKVGVKRIDIAGADYTSGMVEPLAGDGILDNITTTKR